MSKVQPDIQSYIDTQLIECSRLRSIEYNASDNENKPALFTNTQSNGIHIQEGDKISVNSAYVSEVGAGGEVIEILGKKTGKQMTIEYTSTSETGDIVFAPTSFNPYENIHSGSQVSYLMDNSHLKASATTTIETKTFDIADNKIFFTNSYYKTTNGEGYFHLPRRFATSNLLSDIQSLYAVTYPSGAVPEIDTVSLAINKYMTNTWVPNYLIDALGTSTAVYSADAFGEVYTNRPEWYMQCRADHQLSEFVYASPSGYSSTQPIPTPDVPSSAKYKPHLVKKNDNSKYKIYRREKTNWFPVANTREDYVTAMTPSNKGHYLRDIAINIYHPVNDLQSIELDTGFDTPQNIAQSITEQLNTTTERDISVFAINTSSAGIRMPTLPTLQRNIEETPYSRITETPLFKAFESATESSLLQDMSRGFYSGAFENGSGIDFSVSRTDTWKSYNQGTLDYFNSFHHIGVKRPEIYDAGCKINKNRPDFVYQQVQQKVVKNTSGVDIITNIGWEDINASTGNYFLDEFKELFDAQGLYPELFEFYLEENGLNKTDKISVDKTRFLHINVSGALNTQLGCDNWGYVNSASSVSDTPLDDGLIGDTSLPLFVDYDKDQRNNLDKQKYGWNKDDKWGGYFFRGNDSLGERQNYISVRFSLVNEYDTIGAELFNASNEIESSRPIGYDLHFSAYGNSMIALHSGKTMFNWAERGPRSYQARSGSQYVEDAATPSLSLFEDLGGRLYANGFDKFKFLYLGALNPVINFDTVSNRFAFGGLSSPEYAGNFSDAGDPYTNNPNSSPNGNPQQEVYFINKRVKKNSYCPNLVPYNSYREYPNPEFRSWTGAVNPYATGTTFERMNTALSAWTVYDIHSGIVWNNFGSDKLNWSSNSMFGILGFDYDILHPTNPSNYQTIFNVNTSKPNTNGITTNSLVKNTDILAQTQNRSGAPFYNYTMAYTVGYSIIGGDYQQTKANAPPGTATGIGWMSFDKRQTGLDLPQIAQDTTTAFIRATNLPRKTIRPYYLIRSNIIAQDSFIASLGNRLPIIAVVNKVNGYADYYTKEEEGVEFTATKPFTINSITTSIHNPDGTLADVSESSSVIYKIKKSKNITLNLSDVVLDM